MSALAQTNTGDLDISSGNLAVVNNIAQCTAWKLTNRFNFFLGEWFLDQREGVPYFQYVMVSNPNLGVIGSIFRKVCLSVPGVKAVTDIGLNYIASQRNLEVSVAVQTNEGATLTGGVGSPFIISNPGNT